MYLGTRKIRSAGRTSGSIEVTLPAQVQDLEGVECLLVVRDGTRPEIVLQPDLSAAHILFRVLWQRLHLGLEEIGEIGDFSASDYNLAFFPPRHCQERPPLSYSDALAVLRQRVGQTDRVPDDLARLLAPLAVAAGYRLGLKDALALAFGDAVVYLITGTPAELGTDFERGMAHRAFWGEGYGQRPQSAPFDPEVWRQAQSGLRRVYDQFRTWQENPRAYASAREKWYRGLVIEMGVHTFSAEETLAQAL
jgi:hypothetical protein